MSSYDTWLSQAYEDHYYEAEKERREREYHLEQLEGLTEEEIEDYLFDHNIEDPREKQWYLLGGRGGHIAGRIDG